MTIWEAAKSSLTTTKPPVLPSKLTSSRDAQRVAIAHLRPFQVLRFAPQVPCICASSSRWGVWRSNWLDKASSAWRFGRPYQLMVTKVCTVEDQKIQDCKWGFQVAISVIDLRICSPDFSLRMSVDVVTRSYYPWLQDCDPPPQLDSSE